MVNSLLDAESAGALLHLKPETIRAWARAGRIPFVKFGRTVRFRVSDIEAMMQGRTEVDEDE